MRFTTLSLLISLFVVITFVQAKGAVAKYQRRIEEIRRLINKKPTSPMKTKRYKCIEVTDDEYDATNIQLWPKEEDQKKYAETVNKSYKSPPKALAHVTTSSEVEKMEESASNKVMRPSESIMPRARPIPVKDNNYQKVQISNAQQSALYPSIIQNFQNQKSGSFIQELPPSQNYQQPIPEQNFRQPLASQSAQLPPNKPPLILSPQHCSMIKYYANMYAVKDIEGWVRKNCTFAKMFLPRATCDEINVLVASCHL